MPELPEVETVRRGLEPRLRKRCVTKVEVLRPASIDYPSPAQFARNLRGRSFNTIDRRGKYLLFNLDNGAKLGAHLRMSGRLLVVSSDQQNVAREEHVRVKMHLDDGKLLLFEDMRVFGRLWLIPANTPVEDVVPALQELGVEPLSDELNVAYLKGALARKSQAIKSALLDQTIIAGIGNIYADESLHLAGISPLRGAGNLTGRQLEALVVRIKEVLERAIEKRGSSLRNYTDSDGVNGNYQSAAYVYGRTGQECRQCGSTIVRVKLGGRSTHYCPRCQK